MLAPPAWVPTHHQSTLGESGEEYACRELRRRGYVILARRYRSRHGEIDIIARDGEVLVFVEVKTRSTESFGSPLEAVTPAKQRKVIRMAADYLGRSRLFTVACRFDVVGVLLSAGEARIEVVVDAFSVRS